MKLSNKLTQMFLALLTFLLIGNSDLFAQSGRISGFKSLVSQKDNGWIVLEVTPESYRMYEAKNTKKWGVYGLLMCYKVNGVQKAERKDITPDIMEKGKYTHVMSYSPSARVTNIEVEHFDARMPPSSYPKKASCY